MEIENNQKRNSYDDEQLVSEASLSSDCEMKADAASGNPTKISTNTDSQSQNSRKRKMSQLSCNPGMQKAIDRCIFPEEGTSQKLEYSKHSRILC